MLLGQFASKLFSEHPLIIDIRGDIKPELKPDRTPIERHFYDLPAGWNYAQTLVNKGRGLLWEQILKLSDEGLTSEIFWKLISIYDGDLTNIGSSSLLKYLELPVEGGRWIKLYNIRSFELNKGVLTLIDNRNESSVLCFPQEIVNWSNAHTNRTDYYSTVLDLLISLSSFQTSDTCSSLVIRDTFLPDEIPEDCKISESFSLIRFVPFAGVRNDYISTTKHLDMANFNNPIVQIVLTSKNVKQRNELQEFAHALIFDVCRLIKELYKEKKTFATDIKMRSLKRTSLLFLNINWSHYSPDLYPPYKIYIDNDKSFEITEREFHSWANQTISLI